MEDTVCTRCGAVMRYDGREEVLRCDFCGNWQPCKRQPVRRQAAREEPFRQESYRDELFREEPVRRRPIERRPPEPAETTYVPERYTYAPSPVQIYTAPAAPTRQQVGEEHRRALRRCQISLIALATALALPALLFIIAVVLELFASHQASETLLLIVAIWAVIAVPLSLLAGLPIFIFNALRVRKLRRQLASL